jgi:hypothetical protein
MSVVAIGILLAAAIALGAIFSFAIRCKPARNNDPQQSFVEASAIQRPASVIRWELMGAVIAGVLTFAGILILNFAPSGGADIQAWAGFAALMGSLGAALVGLVIGGIYGAIRSRGNRSGPAD